MGLKVPYWNHCGTQKPAQIRLENQSLQWDPIRTKRTPIIDKGPIDLETHLWGEPNKGSRIQSTQSPLFPSCSRPRFTRCRLFSIGESSLLPNRKTHPRNPGIQSGPKTHVWDIQKCPHPKTPFFTKTRFCPKTTFSEKLSFSIPGIQFQFMECVPNKIPGIPCPLAYGLGV